MTSREANNQAPTVIAIRVVRPDMCNALPGHRKYRRSILFASERFDGGGVVAQATQHLIIVLADRRRIAYQRRAPAEHLQRQQRQAGFYTAGQSRGRERSVRPKMR